MGFPPKKKTNFGHICMYLMDNLTKFLFPVFVQVVWYRPTPPHPARKTKTLNVTCTKFRKRYKYIDMMYPVINNSKIYVWIPMVVVYFLLWTYLNKNLNKIISWPKRCTNFIELYRIKIFTRNIYTSENSDRYKRFDRFLGIQPKIIYIYLFTNNFCAHLFATHPKFTAHIWHLTF